MTEQTCWEIKNPPDLLRRVYDILYTHISLSPRLKASMMMMMYGIVDHFFKI
jgi:hypothetical protein